MNTEEQIAKILDAIAHGESGAYMQIVQVHGLMVRSYIGAQVFNGSDVDDLAQETFIAAYRALQHYERGQDFGAWLRGIARNKVLMHFRNSQRRANSLNSFCKEVAAITAHELELQSRSDRHENIAALLRCVSKLPEKLRRVVHAGLDGVKAYALAEILQTTVGAVHQLHYRANQLLRECMKHEVRDA